MRFPVRLTAALLLSLAASRAHAATAVITPDQYLNHVKHLTAKDMKGRGTGTPELDRAAAYIAKEFHKSGLKPAVDGSYYQSFRVSVDSKLGSANALSYSIGEKQTTLAVTEDFIPLGFSGSGRLEAPLVFAGYGISAREYEYDDYGGIDVHGKIVVILSHEPQEYEGGSVFEGRVYTEHSQLFSKALNARIHGAAGVIYVSDTANHSSAEKLEAFTSSVSPDNPGLPFVQVKSAAVEAWFAAAGRDFKAVQTSIDTGLKAQSFAFPETVRVSMSINVAHHSRPVHNVAGYLPGRSDEYVIVGAHYDHLGVGEQFSLAPEKIGTPHPGADDNASGTAGVIAMARWLARQPRGDRGILFIAFAGEELGLLGSSHYVNHPVLPLAKAMLMINMDMIGRIREGKVLVSGAQNGSAYRSRLRELSDRYSLALDLDDSGLYGSSDHTSFKTKLVPVLFFFSGLHADYHRPTDTWEKIEAGGAAKLLNLLSEFVFGLVHRASVSHLAGAREKFTIDTAPVDDMTY
jgi:Zn-dependent M28 family amino/carboxypeptidase